MSQIFISYAREDIDFASKVVDALAENKLETWLDWKSLPKGEKVQEEIFQAIEQSDIFLFLISPDSVTSPWCQKEINHAVKNHKRIIPIVTSDVEAGIIPSEILERNWIFCREDNDDFDKAISEIFNAVSNDYQWVKYHTHLQVKALEWGKRKDNNRLLRGTELQEAEQQLVNAGSKKDPQPTEQQRLYVLESRRDDIRRRRQITAGLTIGFILMSVLCVVAITSSFLASSRENARATAQAIAEEQISITLSQKLASISSQIVEKNPQLAYLLSIKAIKVDETIEAKRALLENLNYSPLLVATLYGHTDSISGLVFSESGNLLAIGDISGKISVKDLLSQNKDTVFDSNVGKEVIFLQFLEETQIVSGTEDGVIQIWDLRTNSYISKFQIDSISGKFNYINIVNHHILVSLESNGTLQLMDLFSKEVYIRKVVKAERVAYIRTIPYVEDAILVLTEDNTLSTSYYWISLSTGDQISPTNKIQTYVYLDEIAASYNQKIIATSGCNAGVSTPCFKGSFDLWDTNSGNRIIETNNTHSDIITAMAFSPDNKFLASASGGSTNLTEKILILLWSLDASTGYTLGSQIGLPLLGHQAEIEKIIFSPNNRYIVSGDKNGIVLLWDLQSNSLYVEGNIIDNIKVSSDGTVILASGASPVSYETSAEVYINDKLEGEIKGYTCSERNLETCGTWLNRTKISNEYPAFSIELTEDNIPIISVKLMDQILRYNLITGETINTSLLENSFQIKQDASNSEIPLVLTLKSGYTISIQIPDFFRGYLSYKIYNDNIYVYDNKNLVVFDLSGKAKGAIVFPDDAWVSNVHIIPEKDLAFATLDEKNTEKYSVIVWDLKDFSVSTQLHEQWGPAFSSAKDIFATVDQISNFVNIWDLSGKKLASFETRASPRLQKLLFSNDGNLLVGHQFTSFSIWDISIFEPLGTFNIDGDIETLTFSGDNRILFIGGCAKMRSHLGCDAGKIQIVHLNNQTLIEKACQLAGRNLTLSEWNDYIGEDEYQLLCPQWTH